MLEAPHCCTCWVSKRVHHLRLFCAVPVRSHLSSTTFDTFVLAPLRTGGVATRQTLCRPRARMCSKIELKPLLCLVLCALSCSLARCAGAACSDCDVLHTGFFSVSKPSVSLAAVAGREGTTSIRLELSQSQVSSSMPVVTVTQGSQEGLRHNVVDTWQFLQVQWLTCPKVELQQLHAAVGATVCFKHRGFISNRMPCMQHSTPPPTHTHTHIVHL
jgi:hypothetical protein